MKYSQLSNQLSIICLIGVMSVVTVARAASFDCAKAAMKVEKLICGHADLSKLDDTLHDAYHLLLKHSDDKEKIRSTQRHWLKHLRNMCQDNACLQHVYTQRIAELTAAQLGHSETVNADHPLRGVYELRATVPYGFIGVGNEVPHFCKAFTDNLNQFRQLDFQTCNARLSPKYPRFSRPQWHEVPLDLGVVEKILSDRSGSMGFKRWQRINKKALAQGKVKLWRIKIDLLKDGHRDTLVRVNHAANTELTYCVHYDSLQMIEHIAEPKAAHWFKVANFNNIWRLGGDMIFDRKSGRYYLLNWRRGSPAGSDGLVVSIDKRATASLMVYTATKDGVAAVCGINWVPARQGKGLGSDKNK